MQESQETQELPFKIEAIPYVIDDNKTIRYLLIKRTPQDGGYWQPVTGTLNDGEKLLSCAKRELNEETGIRAEDIIDMSEVLYKFDWKNKHGETILEFVYAVRYPTNTKIVLNPEEHEDCRWCSFDEAMETLYTDNNKKALKIVNSILLERPTE